MRASFFVRSLRNSRRSSVVQKFCCQTKTARVRCATFATPAISRTHEFHDAVLPHRSTDAIAQARCGPARVRMARRAVASRHAALLRLHLHRLILSHRGDRSPRSPEATRTPSGSSTRGRFVSGVRKGIHHTIKTRLHRAPEASGLLLARGRETSRRRSGCAVPGCFGTGGKRMQSHTDWRFRCTSETPMRSIARTVHSGAGSQGPSGARGAAVAHAGDREKVFRERTKAQRSSSGASRWPPVRIRFVHHWIAQLGRASVQHRESRVRIPLQTRL